MGCAPCKGRKVVVVADKGDLKKRGSTMPKQVTLKKEKSSVNDQDEHPTLTPDGGE